MDCKHARLLLEVAHPIATELEASEKAALAAHLADCPDCGCMAEAEHRVDERLGAAMRDVAVPEGLRERIDRRLQGERDAWWRVRVIRVAGIAAMLLLACWIGYAVWFGRRPQPDLQQVLFNVDQRESGAQVVEQAFAVMGVNMTAPRKFDYRYLTFSNLSVFPDNNKMLVPCLTFVRQQPNGVQISAQVYVLPDRTFNIEAIREAKPNLVGSHWNIMVHVEQEYPHGAFVVIYTGQSINDFFKDTKPVQ
jgi:hypothetical protein